MVNGLLMFVVVRLHSLPRDGGPGGDEEGAGRVQTGEAGSLPPRPLPHHTEVLGRGHEQAAGLLRA